jgi:hypothetical protein
MDYSASINDAEHPAEASPWGSSPGSSPEHHRAAFASGISSDFSSHVPSNGLAHDQEEGGFETGETGYKRPDTATSASTSDVPTHELNPETEGPEQARQDGQQHLSRSAGEYGQPGQEQQIRRPVQPQFKLQAKITGLERTGRKDPILRFDIHVRTSFFRHTTLNDPELHVLTSRNS